MSPPPSSLSKTGSHLHHFLLHAPGRPVDRVIPLAPQPSSTREHQHSRHRLLHLAYVCSGNSNLGPRVYTSNALCTEPSLQLSLLLCSLSLLLYLPFTSFFSHHRCHLYQIFTMFFCVCVATEEIRAIVLSCKMMRLSCICPITEMASLTATLFLTVLTRFVFVCSCICLLFSLSFFTLTRP